MIIKNIDKRALSEVYAYLNFVGPRYLKKIPKELIQIIRNKMDKKYYYHLPIIDMIAYDRLMKETKVMIAYIECNYIISNKNTFASIINN